MNELQAYRERKATYEIKIAQLKATRDNLQVYLESGSMKQIEVDARTEFINESIEMYQEKIDKYNELLGHTTKIEVGQKVEVVYGVFNGASGIVKKVTLTQVIFESESGMVYRNVNPDELRIVRG